MHLHRLRYNYYRRLLFFSFRSKRQIPKLNKVVHSRSFSVLWCGVCSLSQTVVKRGREGRGWTWRWGSRGSEGPAGR